MAFKFSELKIKSILYYLYIFRKKNVNYGGLGKCAILSSDQDSLLAVLRGLRVAVDGAGAGNVQGKELNPDTLSLQKSPTSVNYFQVGQRQGPGGGCWLLSVWLRVPIHANSFHSMQWI